MLYTIIIAIVLLILILTVSGITRFGFHQMTRMRLRPAENITNYLERTGIFTIDKYDSMSPRQVQVTSHDGTRLSGQVLEAHPDSKDWVILVHGITCSLLQSIPFAGIYEEAGFNVLLIDQRRHGQSEGKYTTYGYHEKHDVESWVEWILEHYGEDCQVGLHGQSLGGGTVLEYLGIAHPAIKFVVADCPYSDLTELIHYQLTVLNKLPAFPFLRLIDRRLGSKAGFRLAQVSPIRNVQASQIPVLFIHGTEDRYVPTWMSQNMYDVKTGPKELLLVPGAVHANAYETDPKRYKETVAAFAKQHLASVSADPAEALV
ncbi:alpha/beta hydrolase [Paenibacillus sp. CAA11]|uniref:alpha/beta hydrolase n=1 Tax=Paenibacillus sp. CAA11 TaxID=1532905 RepID=UPI000D393A42|nr:alpha/beta hydrolase [Paenibacillus sp. CAA11]AWB43324.1 alpha/beta hydrolase [Paenibacillus sp. CAA11]